MIQIWESGIEQGGKVPEALFGIKGAVGGNRPSDGRGRIGEKGFLKLFKEGFFPAHKLSHSLDYL